MKRLLQLRNSNYSQKTDEEILKALELLSDDGLNYGALILLGKKEKIDQLLPGAEIIFEWRQESNKIPHDFRREWREPFLKIFDDVWKMVSDRNTRIPLQEGLIQREILAFNELAIREAILNAITHRDYTIVSQSVFIKTHPGSLLIISPGSFLPGITPENVLEKQAWRNRRIAEVFQKLGLVERSGQGMDQIFESTIRDGNRYYSYEEKPGIYTRIKGLTREHKKQLILEHIKREGHGIMYEFVDIFPELKPSDITNFLQELKREELIFVEGKTNNAIWKLVNKGDSK